VTILRKKFSPPGRRTVGALTLALEVRPVTSRTLLLGGEIGLQRCDGSFECGDHVGDRPVMSRWPRGQRLVPDLFEVDGSQGLVVAARAREPMALDDGAPLRRRR
jgi:hypothetical protein